MAKQTPYYATMGDYVVVYGQDGTSTFRGTVVHVDATHFDVKLEEGGQFKYPQGTMDVEYFSSAG